MFPPIVALAVPSMKTKKVPELNDEFAQGIGEYKTIEELRAKVRQDLEKHRQNHANEELRDKLLVWLEHLLPSVADVALRWRAR